MILAVAKDHVARSGQGGDGAQVGSEAEENSKAASVPSNSANRCFQPPVQSGVAGHQRAGAAAPAFAAGRIGDGLGQSRIGGQRRDNRSSRS